jgi:hypothetical protein
VNELAVVILIGILAVVALLLPLLDHFQKGKDK